MNRGRVDRDEARCVRCRVQAKIACKANLERAQKGGGCARVAHASPSWSSFQVWFLDVRYGWLQACPTLVCSFNAADGVTDRFPSGSYGHATVNVNNTFYVFGGATADDNVKVWLCG